MRSDIIKERLCFLKSYIMIHSVNFGSFLRTENLEYFFRHVLNRYND
jgi:hypothetical protein